MKLEATISFNKIEKAEESSEAVPTAEVVATGASAAGASSKTPSLASGKA